jgi:hypothetical protein
VKLLNDNSIECRLGGTHLRFIRQLGIPPLLVVKVRKRIMVKKIKLTLIAGVAALSVALPTVAFAQSAYTTGTESSSVAAGYPSPYGS